MGKGICKYYEASQSQKIFYVRDLYSKININSTIVLHITEFDYLVLKTTLSTLIRRHDIFRTTLVFNDNKLMQKVEAYSHSLLNLELFDIRNEKNRELLLNKIYSDSNQYIFKSDKSPWLTVKAVLLKENSLFLIITVPHMISDERSKEIIQDELCRIYTSSLTGEKLNLQKPYHYGEYISETENLLNSSKGERHKMYWIKALKDPPVLNLSSFFYTKNKKKTKSYRESIHQEIKNSFGKVTKKAESDFIGTVSFIDYK